MKEKDLDVKVATKREELWMRVRENLRKRITAYEEELEIAIAQLALAETIIKEEHAL